MVVLYFILAYLLTGVAFAIVFLIWLVDNIDENVKDAPWTFRLIIFPGTVVLWPVMLSKVITSFRKDNG